MNFSDLVFKGRELPIGTKRKHGNVMKVKTPKGWVPVKEAKESKGNFFEKLFKRIKNAANSVFTSEDRSFISKMTDVAQLRAMKEALEKQIGPSEKKEKKKPAAKKETKPSEKKEKKEPKPKKGISPRQMLAAINRRLDRIDPNPGETKLVEKMSDLKGLKGPFKVTRVGSENLFFTDGSGQEYRLKDSMAQDDVLEAGGKLVGMEKVKGEWKKIEGKKDAPKAEKKETPGKSFDPKDESSFVETFDGLKTGQIIKVRFDAVMGGSSAGEFKVGRRTKSKKYSRPEAITLIPMKDGKPVKTSETVRFRITKERSFADGNIFVGGTIGDMAVEIKELGRPKDFVQAEPSKEAEGKMTAAERKRLDVLQAKEDKQELSGAEEKTYTALVEKYRETAEYKAAQKKDAPKAEKKGGPMAGKLGLPEDSLQLRSKPERRLSHPDSLQYLRKLEAEYGRGEKYFLAVKEALDQGFIRGSALVGKGYKNPTKAASNYLDEKLKGKKEAPKAEKKEAPKADKYKPNIATDKPRKIPSMDGATFHDKLEVDDYPYGRQRTKAIFSVETMKNGNQRGVMQTVNPKTGRLNKPKKTTSGKAVKIVQVDGKTYIATDTGNGAIYLQSAAGFKSEGYVRGESGSSYEEGVGNRFTPNAQASDPGHHELYVGIYGKGEVERLVEDMGHRLKGEPRKKQDKAKKSFSHASPFSSIVKSYK